MGLGGAVLAVVALAVTTALVVLYSRWRAAFAAQRAGNMARFAKLLAGGKMLGPEHAVGSLRGRVVDVEFVEWGGPDSEQRWTQIRVDLGDTTMELSLRGEDVMERALVRATGAVDVQVGDAEFDAAFVVEGAPPEATKAVLADAGVRRRLLNLRSFDLSTKAGRLLFSRRGCLEHGELVAATELMVTLAVRMHSAEHLLPVAPKMGEAGTLAPYRASPVEAAGRADELTRLREGQRRYGRASKGLVVAFFAGVVVLAAGLTLWGRAC